MAKRKIYTSECVAEGHPDKVCDQIADAILDACLAKDSLAHVACECMFIEKLLILGGEISFSKPNITIDYESIAKEVIKNIGYDRDDVGLLNYRDVIIENQQAIEMASIYSSILSSTIEVFGTIISNNLNKIMKFLAGLTIVISIPTIVASFMGMNVPLGMFSDNPLSFFIIFLLSIILSIIAAVILKNKNML